MKWTLIGEEKWQQ